ncbi:MAG: hypothetical protein SLAVMIC_00804 [uncultured marine phage]|uniref:Uncharacterized protein n=1 Tax=uncultured marine phage TaxID=707152 RepID=A0A8D9CC66_9VIRU|nr:MAG: hypothetical protein SLAVMIC_00804 [uncultured marine phage]
MKKFNEFVNESNEDNLNESLREDKKRIQDAVSEAEMAFWVSISEKYPEVTTGDLDPGASIALSMAMEEAVDAWLMFNDPNSSDDPTIQTIE